MDNIFETIKAFLPLITAIIMIVSNWRIFTKLGLAGWKSLIPIYNTWCLLEELYGSGISILLYLIPIYNIYYGFKVTYDLIKSLGHGTGFFIGNCFFPYIFTLIMAFDNNDYYNDTCDGICVPALIITLLPLLLITFLILSATPIIRMFI